MKCLGFVLSFLFAASIWSKEIRLKETNGNFSVELQAPNDHFTLLEEVQLAVKLTFPPGYEVDLNEIRAQLLYHSFTPEAPFTLTSQRNFPVEKRDQLLIQKILFKLDPQFTGTHYLTLLGIDFLPKTHDLRPMEVISPILEITVTTPAEAVEAPLIEPLMNLSMQYPVDLNTANRLRLMKESSSMEQTRRLFQEREIPWLGILVLTLGLIFLFTFKPPAKKGINREKEEAGIKEKTRQKLAALPSLIQEGKFHEFYFELTSAVRKFFEEYYHLEAGSRTTEEFLSDRLVQSIFTKSAREKIRLFLEQADLIKYSNQEVNAEDCEKALKTAQSLIPPS